jgi:hypothetical protein
MRDTKQCLSHFGIFGFTLKPKKIVAIGLGSSRRSMLIVLCTISEFRLCGAPAARICRDVLMKSDSWDMIQNLVGGLRINPS